MRRLFLLAILFLAACMDNSLKTKSPSYSVPHVPVVQSVDLSIENALYMEGDGNVPVTVWIEARDASQDIQTMNVRMSNGAELTLVAWVSYDDTYATVTAQFDVATTEVGLLTIEFQLVDTAGYVSRFTDREILVIGHPDKWMARSASLPNALNDVVSLYGGGFIAVGDAGTIMTSADGLTWVAEDSGTTVDLHAVVCDSMLYGCFAAGDDGTILQSGLVDQGWGLFYDGPDGVSLNTLTFAGFDGFIAAGTVTATDTACLLVKIWPEFSWTMIEPLAESGQHITDVGAQLIGDMMALWLVATIEAPFPEQGKVLVSADGQTWVDVFISDGHESTYSTINHDDRLWLGGTGGRIYASADGMNWTQFDTAADQSRFVAMQESDVNIMALGFSEAVGLGAQLGVVTSDSGQTWQEFVIGSAYEPRGLAYSNGRWVSVGQSLADPGKGAIYTTE